MLITKITCVILLRNREMNTGSDERILARVGVEYSDWPKIVFFPDSQ